MDVGKQLTLFDVVRKFKNQNTGIDKPSAKRHFVLNKNRGSQDSTSDGGCETSKDSPGVESNSNKCMGTEWVEMTHVMKHQSVVEGSHSNQNFFERVSNEPSAFEGINGQHSFSDKTSGHHGASFRIPSEENALSGITSEQSVSGLTNIKQSVFEGTQNKQSAFERTQSKDSLWNIESITDDSTCSSSHVRYEDKQLSSSVSDDEINTDQEGNGAARTRGLILDLGPLEDEYQRIKALEVDLKVALYGMYSETSAEQSQQKQLQQQQQQHEEQQHNLVRRSSRIRKEVASQCCAATKDLVSTCRPCSVVLQPLGLRHSFTSKITVVTNNVVKVS